MTDQDSSGLRGKIAIVAGGGQGGGMGAAFALARRGANVVLFGRTLAKLESVAQRIADYGARAICVAGDVTRAEDRRRCIDAAIEEYGRIDILVNAVQSPAERGGAMLDMTTEMMAEFWESGFTGMFEFMRGCHPHMKAAGGGSIINFGSGAVYNPKGYAVYAAVKVGVQAMSRAAALEWAPDNIRVNVINPLVMSGAFEEYIARDPAGAAAVAKAIPLGRIGDPEQDIGRPIAFLAGDDSSFITGTTLGVDGGGSYVR